MSLRKIFTFSLIIVVALVICWSGQAGARFFGNDDQQQDPTDLDWEEIVSRARGSRVNFYMWGGSRTINQWVDEYVAEKLREKYEIELNRVPMGPDDYLNKLLAEKQVGKDKGSIDVLWINGENFRTAREQELLYGPFVEKLPNYREYIDGDSERNTTDFGYPTGGYEAPYSRAQFVFIYDRSRIEQPPVNYEELLEWIRKNPGKFTYPALPDFTGSAFVRHVVYRETGGYEQYYDMDKEDVKQAIRPALEKLKELEPYLWREGETYPATVAQLDNMFADGEVWMSMGYEPTKASTEISKGNYPETAASFVLEGGTISNTNFLAIPFNAPNKEGALVTINFLEGFEAQLSKYKPENWGALPVFDFDKLSAEQQQRVEQVDLGQGSLPQATLDEHSLPEIPAELVPVIEEEWQSVVGQ